MTLFSVLRPSGIIFVSALFLSAFSCKKSDDPQPAVSSKIKTYIEIIKSPSQNNADTFSISYDGQGRMTSGVSKISGYQFIYQYNGTTSYTMDLKMGTHTQIHELFFLNADKLTDSTFQYNDTNDSTTEKYIYNSAKQLTQLKRYSYTQKKGGVFLEKEDYTYDNGNLSKAVQTAAAGTINFYINYTYTSLKAPVFSLFAIAPSDQIIYLPATISTVYPGTPSVTVTYTATYTFDSMNRLTSQTQVNATGATIIYKYIY